MQGKHLGRMSFTVLLLLGCKATALGLFPRVLLFQPHSWVVWGWTLQKLVVDHSIYGVLVGACPSAYPL